MNEGDDKRASDRYHKRYLHYLLFFALLATSLILWWFLYDGEREQRGHIFYDEAEHIVVELEDALVLYKILLNAGVGVFTSSDKVNREEWQLFHKYQQTKAEFPTFQSLCYLPLIKGDNLKNYIQSLWAQGFSEYEIVPLGPREYYAPVMFIEPLDSINIKRLGYDYFSRTVRRQTMEIARDVGDVVVSPEIGIFDGKDTVPGFMMVAPVYTKGILPVSTDERRREISGFVAVNIKTGEFARSVFEKFSHRLNVRICDILESPTDTTKFKVLYHYNPTSDSGIAQQTFKPRFTFEKILDVNHHNWRIVIESTPEFEKGIIKLNQILVLLLGIIVSLLTLFLLNTLSATVVKAKKLAGQLVSSLQESESKLRKITDNISDVIFTTDINLNTNYISPSIEKLTGYKVDEYLKLTMEQRHPKESIDYIKRLYLEEMSKETDPSADKSRTRVVEMEHFKADGSIITTSMHLSFLRDSDGNFTGIQGVTRDITEQKKAQQELYEKTAYLENLVNYANAPILVWDSNNVITRFNGAFEQLSGRTASEVIGKKIDILFPEESRDKLIPLINQTKSGERWETVEIEILCKDRSVRTLLWNSANIYNQKDQSLNATIAQGFDITDVKRTNEALKIAKERAEESDRLKTAFINNISHEIRTPLNGILGFGQLLSECNTTTEERETYYSLLKSSSDRLIQAVTDNLDIASITSGSLMVNNIDFPVKQFLDNVIENAINQAKPFKKIEVKGEISPEAQNLVINTDRELLRKAINHLISNAIKFTDSGTVTIGINVGDHSLEFYVADTGRGIAKDKFERIFNPYVQEITEMTRGYEGTGLGLAIVKGIAGLLEGEVVLESEKGEGSVFYFTIPRRESSAKKESLPLYIKEAHIPGNPLILVAEDDESSYLFQQVVLRKAGYNVVRAINGIEAVELCKTNNQIDLALMDVKMPLMDGIEATKMIKNIRKDLPVIAVTAYAQPDDEFRVMRSGCDDYITKPVKSDLLLSKISKFLN